MSLAEAVRGHFANWHGLAPELDPDEVARILEARWQPGNGLEVRAGQAFLVLAGQRDEPPARIEAWLPRASRSVAALAFRPPPDIEHAAILGELGEPDVVLDSNRLEPGSVVYEHVHAQRGVTLAVAEPFPEADGAQGPPQVVFVQLYPAMSTQAFVTTIGRSGEELRPYPRPPGT